MLTARQKQVYEIAKQYIEQHGYAPTVAEIAQVLGIRSRGVVHRNLKVLAEQQWIRLLPNRRRNIELLTKQPVRADEASESIPMMGVIAAGMPIEALPDVEMIDVGQFFSRHNYYALKVRGSSMTDEGIIDGDVIICEMADHAISGQIVVALIDREFATLKRIYWESDGRVKLVPANQGHIVQYYAPHQVIIQGIYRGLIRSVD